MLIVVALGRPASTQSVGADVPLGELTFGLTQALNDHPHDAKSDHLPVARPATCTPVDTTSMAPRTPSKIL
jgi:hypothetical protein